MTLWRQFRPRRACLFVALVAVLAGCDSNNDAMPSPAASTSSPDTAATSTFDTTQVTQTSNVATEPGIPNVPAVGDVTVVPDTKASPVTGGGLPLPATPTATNVVPPVALQVRAPRFTEIAPDTIGGATYQSSETLSYDLGNLVASTGGELSTFSHGKIFITPVKGWLRYPQTALDPLAKSTRYPVIVLLHGMHQWIDPSYKGYNYIAEDLAAHGYVVLSIDANAINRVYTPDSPNPFGDASSQSRAQLVLGTLDRLRQIDKQGQVDKDGKIGLLDPLKGKLDFNRIGIMGHSRGGQGVSNTVIFNQTRHGVSAEELLRALRLAPDDFTSTYPDLVSALTVPEPPLTFSVLVARMSAALDGISEAWVRSVFGSTEPSAEMLANLGKSYPPAVPTAVEAALSKYNIFFAADAGIAPPYDFKGAFMLASTDGDGNLGINNVPMAVLLPSCDGDVSSLEGARLYDHNRVGPETDVAPRYQLMVKGANHNFYNTVWSADDSSGSSGYCSPGPAGSIRLSAEDQRLSGNFIISSFMRYHVGGEQKFAAYWNGTAQLPAAACHAGTATCDERILLTIQKDSARRKLIQRFDADDNLSIDQLGGAFALKDFEASARCDMPYGGSVSAGSCSPSRLPGFEYSPYNYATGGLLSIAEHAELVWTKPNASVTADLGGISATGYDSLTFRIAVVRPFGQEVEVTLTDSAGHYSKVLASDYSDALYNAPRPKADGMPMVDNPADTPFNDGQVRILMNMVSIPLKAFPGIDTTNLKQLKLNFPRESGKVAITDIELQNFGREKAVTTLAGK